jgi:filamentous hemagglutinin family protein
MNRRIRRVLPQRTACTVGAVTVAAALLRAGGSLAAQLPVPCLAGACSSYNKATNTTSPVAGFVTVGQASATQSGNTLTVTQSTNQALLNWSSFNVSADGKVVFQQPGATSIALNKIYQASPSAVFGTLSANGQVYLINPNGFVFGNGSVVNVAGLVASSLSLSSDSELTSGLLTPGAQSIPGSALQSDGRSYVTDSSGHLVLDAQGQPQPVQVIVQSGAQLAAADGGRLLLAGQSVVNGGSLSAPDGQIALAAGQSVYLAASGDPALRGLIVEVTGTGAVTNQAGASLSAARGNVSLVGLAVNQDGRISATTAVSANGSVILQAGNDALLTGGYTGCKAGETLCLNQGGTLTIGATSDIEVEPDPGDTSTAVVGQQQIQSRITLQGEQVFIDGGQIKAAGGTLNVLAAANPDQGLVSEGNAAAQLRVAAGTTIDLSGSVAQLPMAANLLTVQLRGNELEDDPVQRNGALRGQTVIVDTRSGDPPIISQSSWNSALQGVQESILQRTAVGGSASFQSEGDIVVGSGATINVSGGQWNYAPGVTQTSQLIAANGQTYDIATASPSMSYVGVLNPTYTQTYNGFGVQSIEPIPGLSHYQSGYAEGFSAGTVTFAAPKLALQGALVGTAVDGPYQRSAAGIPASSLAALVGSNGSGASSGADAMAVGGTLIIGDATPVYSSAGLPYFFAPAVEFTNSAPPVSVADGTPLPSQPLQLPVAYLAGGGFSQTQIYSDLGVTLPAGLALNLGAGGALAAVAPVLAIDSSIQALGGSIVLQSVATADYQGAGRPRSGIDVADGVTLDVSGQWINNSPDSAASARVPTFQNGGAIDLSLNSSLFPSSAGGALVLGSDVSLLASGGAWINAGNAVAGGAGGSITLDASPFQSALQLGADVRLAAFGVQGAAGGKFSLAAPRIEVGPGTAWAEAQRIDDLNAPGVAFQLGSALFSQYGFSSVRLAATAPVLANAASNDLLTIAAGTSIDASAQSLQLDTGYLTRASGGTVAGFSSLATLPVANQAAYTVSLQVAPAGTDPSNSVLGDLDIQTGASLVMTPNSQSAISLTGQGSILIDGLLSAPGGSISAQIGTPVINDLGFLPAQRLELGTHGVLNVAGATVLTPNKQQLPLGTVLPGGTISLVTQRGEILADAGSMIDVAGASAVLDVQAIGGTGGYSSATVGSAGGTLNLSAVESVSLLGSLSAAAGPSSAGTIAGGTLDLVFSPAGATTPGGTPFPATPFVIELVSSTAGSTPSPSNGNIAVLGVAQLQQSGIDVLMLQAASAHGAVPIGTILLDSDTPLSLAREISLNAPNIAVAPGIVAALQAPYVALGDAAQATAAASASAGSGSLDVTADQIGLSGFLALQGTGSTLLTSSGDVELLAVSGSQLAGALNTAGNLTIDAARIYPATEASFTIANPSGSIVIAQNGLSPGTPLSAAGSLSIQAANITSSGTLLAPFGQITLAASTALSLQSGSITSVSGAGELIPFGQTAYGGAEWIYQAGNATSRVTAIPNRQIALSAPQVTLASGATVDLSGGGDLVAYEWVPGLGGSTNALAASNAAASGLYSVLPSMQGQYAAYDLQGFTGSSVGTGASVYLSGGAGLAAGVYPLLPASDALLPGAYLVQVQKGYQSLGTGIIGALADGTPVVAGYLSFGNTGLHTASAGYSGFAIYPGSYGESLAQYTIAAASGFFSAAAASTGQTQVALPADAGTLSIAVGSNLNALGTVKSAAATGGTAAIVDIYTTGPSDLTITADAQAGGGGIVLQAPVIQSWDPGTLVLGGQLSADGSTINVTAQTVTFGAGAQVTAGQILAVADQSILVQSGAVLASNSGASARSLQTLPTAQSLALTGPGSAGAALLAVSDSELPVASRTGTGPGATIDVEAGAVLSTRGAVALDAPGVVSVAGVGSIAAPGASWSLASSSIAFVGPNGTSGDSLQIDSALLAELQTAGAVRLSSATTLDLATPVTLGIGAGAGPSLPSLILTAASINNLGGSSEFAAGVLRLQGLAGGSAAPTGGGGTLEFLANTLQVGAGNLSINGDSTTLLQASGALAGQDSSALASGALSIGGNATINAAELTATGGATTAGSAWATTISVPTGTLQLLQNGAAAAPASLGTSLGGSLTLTAGQIQGTASLIVPGGQIALQAAGSLALDPGTVVDTAGIVVSAAGQTAGAGGGIVRLTAGADLTLAPGSSISVAGAGAAPAGVLTLAGGGTVSLGATLAGNAAGSATGGSFSVDAGQLAGGLPALTASLAAAGFSNQIAVRVRSGDLDAAAGTVLTANQLSLTADSGAIDIAGTLSAPSAGLRGAIGLFANGNVTLESTALLQANGSGSAGRGGDIELSTVSGVIALDGGSVIAASGAAQSGTLWLRAPALLGSSDVGIGHIGSDVGAVGQIVIEPVLPAFQSNADFTLDFSQIQNALTNFLTLASSAIPARLQPSGGPPLLLEPGVVVDTNGALSLSQQLDLYQLQLGAPIDLTVRASGSITIDGQISDGIDLDGSYLNFNGLSTAASSTLRFVAGADLASANPLATIAGSGANLVLDAGASVQTGTGEIDLVAANDVRFAAATQYLPGAAAYTTGNPGAATVNVNLGGAAGTETIDFPANGGNVLVQAGRDVIGAPLAESVSDWQLRYIPASNGPAEYGVNLVEYQLNPWNLATLGGGDLRVVAGRDVTNLSSAAADSLALAGSTQAGWTQTHQASGGLAVQAGRDITSGQFFLADGLGTLNAGGSFGTNLNVTANGGGAAIPVGSLFYLEDAQLALWAQGSINIAAILNPTVIYEPLAVRGTLSQMSFFTYGADSAFSAQSTAGNITVNDSGLALLVGRTVVQFSSTAFGDAPASLQLTALSQNLELAAAGETLFPSNDGQLSLFAGQDIVSGSFILSDAPDAVVPTAASPLNGTPSIVQLTQNGAESTYAFDSGRHAADPNPALVVAGRDINGSNFAIPKPGEILAGRDILNLEYRGQNLSATDLTVFDAGRDFVDQVAFNAGGGVATSPVSVQLGGPGSLDILAGGNIDLGFSAGVTTVGNLTNPNLATTVGAQITMLAGLGQNPDYAAFYQQVIEPSAAYQQQLLGYVQSVTGQNGLSVAQADTEFATFTAQDQLPLIDGVFFNELNLSGLEANQTPALGYSRGYAAIDALFPGTPTSANGVGSSGYRGDLDLTYSRIYTLDGGGIALLVPGGAINVGLANPPAASANAAKPPSQLGIVTQGSGNLDVYSLGDVNVNASRIFTLGGGNILIWSQQGSIDAGNGAKSSLSLPPPTYTVDAAGNVQIVFNAAVAGSGIRTIQTSASESAGNVDLIAPEGSVNAGDAGIGAAGNINIAAVTVTGIGNISFGGSATGVPAVVSNIAAALSGASSAASSVATAANGALDEAAAARQQGAAPLAQAALGWLDVFVTGLGEENCRPDDLECIKRQKHE